MMSLAVQSCLLPPPGEELPEVVNRPPRIHVENLSPHPTFGPLLMSRACPEEFFATISDPDADPLYYRVFIDYFRGSRGDAHNPEIVEVVLDPTDRRRSIGFTPDGSMFDGDNPHTVELLVADRDFTRDLRGGRELVDELVGQKDAFMWTVVLNDALPCGDL